MQTTINSLVPTNTIEIYEGTCESNGYKDMISNHECSLAIGEAAYIQSSTNRPVGCFEYTYQSVSVWEFNVLKLSTVTLPDGRTNKLICKK